MTEFYFHFDEIENARDQELRITTHFTGYSIALHLAPRMNKYYVEGRGYRDIWRLSVGVESMISHEDLSFIMSKIQHEPNYAGWHSYRGIDTTENERQKSNAIPVK